MVRLEDSLDRDTLVVRAVGELPDLFDRDSGYEKLTGEYAAHRDVMSITVEQEGPTLRVKQETPQGEQTAPLFPQSLDPDVLSFYTVTKSGTRQNAGFRDDDGTSLVFQRLKYRKE